ncbi:hypothetical protein [Herpetosiphon sp. NSE202]
MHEPQFAVAARRYWYRVIGPRLAHYPLQPARNYSLNEAYLWLMQQAST